MDRRYRRPNRRAISVARTVSNTAVVRNTMLTQKRARSSPENFWLPEYQALERTGFSSGSVMSQIKATRFRMT